MSPCVEKVLVSKRTNTEVKNEEGRPMVATAFRRSYSNNVAEIMDAEDPLLHFTLQDQPENQRNVYNGWLYGANCYTFKNVFNYEETTFTGVRPILVG
jgi:acetyl-CoA synthetase